MRPRASRPSRYVAGPPSSLIAPSLRNDAESKTRSPRVFDCANRGRYIPHRAIDGAAAPARSRRGCPDLAHSLRLLRVPGPNDFRVLCRFGRPLPVSRRRRLAQFGLACYRNAPVQPAPVGWMPAAAVGARGVASDEVTRGRCRERHDRLLTSRQGRRPLRAGPSGDWQIRAAKSVRIPTPTVAGSPHLGHSASNVRIPTAGCVAASK